jgi:hypothetical protein
MDKFNEIYLKLITEAEEKNSLKTKLSDSGSVPALQKIQDGIVSTNYLDMFNSAICRNQYGYPWYGRLTSSDKYATKARFITFEVAENEFNGGRNDWAVVLHPFGEDVSPTTPTLQTLDPNANKGFAIYATKKDIKELQFTKYTNIEEVLTNALEGKYSYSEQVLQFYDFLITTGEEKLKNICIKFWELVDKACYKFWESNIPQNEQNEIIKNWKEQLIEKYPGKISQLESLLK